MPAKQQAHWTERLGWSRPCHYNDAWLAFAVTLPVDLVLARIAPKCCWRYVAVLFEAVG